MAIAGAARLADAAAALPTPRYGAAPFMPSAHDVTAFLATETASQGADRHAA